MSKNLENMSFGEVIEALLDGKRAFRKGWHGKGMFIFEKPSQTYQTNEKHKEWTGWDAVTITHHILIFADNKLTPWVASQADVFAIDWVVME